MEGATVDRKGGFLEGFTEGGVRVDGAGKVFGAAAVFHVCNRRGNHLGGALGNDLYAEEAVAFSIGDHFGKAIGRIGRNGATIGEKVEFTHLDLEPFFFGGSLSESNTRDFRFGVNYVGNTVVIDVPCLTSDALDAGHRFFLGFMRKHGAGGDVANRVDARRGGAVMWVNRDAAFLVAFNAHLFKAEALGVGAAANCHQNFIGFKLELFAVLFRSENRVGTVLVETGDFGAKVKIEALFFEEAFGGFGDILVKPCRDVGKEFDDLDLGAKACPDRAEFEADRARTNDRQLFRYFGEGDGFVAADNSFAIKGKEGEFNNAGTGRKDDVFRFKGSFGLSVDAYLIAALKTAEPMKDLYFIGFHEVLNAAAQLIDGGGLFRHELADINGGFLDLNPVCGSAVCGEVKHLGRVQECLAGDAADVKAGAAKVVVFFDKGGLEPELGGADRGNVAAGARTDDNAIE